MRTGWKVQDYEEGFGFEVVAELERCLELAAKEESESEDPPSLARRRTRALMRIQSTLHRSQETARELSDWLSFTLTVLEACGTTSRRLTEEALESLEDQNYKLLPWLPTQQDHPQP